MSWLKLERLLFGGNIFFKTVFARLNFMSMRDISRNFDLKTR